MPRSRRADQTGYSGTSLGWANTTHDWAAASDVEHLQQIARSPEVYAPGGMAHLVLEVLAYTEDEAASQERRGQVVVTRHRDGSLSVSDDGRGTDTRVDRRGRPVVKPVMSTLTSASSTTRPRRHCPTGISAAACPS